MNSVLLLSKEQQAMLVDLVNQSAFPDDVKAALLAAVKDDFSPTVVVGIEGDYPQGATSNCPINVVVIDHDRDQDDPEYARELIVLIDAQECEELAQFSSMSEEDYSDEDQHARPSAC